MGITLLLWILPTKMTDSDDGAKEAFCPLLWRANGGAINRNGNPILGRNSDTRGYCTRPYDCYSCEVMQVELSQVPVNMQHWLCPGCISSLCEYAKEIGNKLNIPGFYSEGECQSIVCIREETETRVSILLQLVLGSLA